MNPIKIEKKMSIRMIFGSACVLVFAGFISTGHAESVIMSDFNNGTDEIFSRFDLLGGGRLELSQ